MDGCGNLHSLFFGAEANPNMLYLYICFRIVKSRDRRESDVSLVREWWSV